MPVTKICKKNGCGRTAIPGKNYCMKHQELEYNATRKVFTRRGKSGEYNNLYHSAGWKNLRKEFLTKYPVCFICGKPATIADHIQPHRGDLSLFYNIDNLQPMCWSCHSRKTFKENDNFNKRSK